MYLQYLQYHDHNNLYSHSSTQDDYQNLFVKVYTPFFDNQDATFQLGVLHNLTFLNILEAKFQM